MSFGIMAIVSKAVFERDHRAAKPGDVLVFDRYISENPGLRGLADGQPLFLVTVRAERLWRVAILERLSFGSGAWRAEAPNVAPVADITPLVSKLRFTTGAGIKVEPSRLAMSLQTPRSLTEADARALRAVGAVAVAPPKPERAPTAAPAKSPDDAPLAEAVAAAERGDLDAALSALLQAWRAQPVPALAERIERIGVRLSTGAPPNAAAWSKRAHQAKPAELGPLLATLFDGTVKIAIERAELLATWPADPRLDMFLAETFAKVPFRSTSARPFWVRLMRRQPLVLDPRVLPILDRCRAAYGDDYAERYLDELITRLLRDRPRLEAHAGLELAASAKRLLDRLDAVLGREGVQTTGRESAEALLERVLAQPEDDEARQVLGDVLAEAGDVRGELIALQYKGERETLTTAQRRREAKILEEHFSALVGPLAPVVLKKGARFRRGFLSACIVKTTNPRQVAAIASSPWWATVEHLEGPSEVFFQPAMRSLRSLSMALIDAPTGTRDSIAALCARGLPRLEQLECAVDEEESSLEALLETKALPSLKALAIRLAESDILRFFASALVGRLEHLRVGLPLGPGPSLVGRLDPLRWRDRAETLGLRSFEMELCHRHLPRATRFAFHVGSGKKLSRLTIEVEVEGAWLDEASPGIVGVLSRISRSDIESLTIRPRRRVPGGPALDALAKAAARLGGSVDTSRPPSTTGGVFA